MASFYGAGTTASTRYYPRFVQGSSTLDAFNDVPENCDYHGSYSCGNDVSYNPFELTFTDDYQGDGVGSLDYEQYNTGLDIYDRYTADPTAFDWTPHLASNLGKDAYNPTASVSQSFANRYSNVSADPTPETANLGQPLASYSSYPLVPNTSDEPSAPYTLPSSVPTPSSSNNKTSNKGSPSTSKEPDSPPSPLSQGSATRTGIVELWWENPTSRIAEMAKDDPITLLESFASQPPRDKNPWINFMADFSARNSGMGRAAVSKQASAEWERLSEVEKSAWESPREDTNYARYPTYKFICVCKDRAKALFIALANAQALLDAQKGKEDRDGYLDIIQRAHKKLEATKNGKLVLKGVLDTTTPATSNKRKTVSMKEDPALGNPQFLAEKPSKRLNRPVTTSNPSDASPTAETTPNPIVSSASFELVATSGFPNATSASVIGASTTTQSYGSSSLQTFDVSDSTSPRLFSLDALGLTGQQQYPGLQAGWYRGAYEQAQPFPSNMTHLRPAEASSSRAPSVQAPNLLATYPSFTDPGLGASSQNSRSFYIGPTP